MIIPFFIIEYFVIKWAVKNSIKQYYAEKEQFEKLTRQLDEHHKKNMTETGVKKGCEYVGTLF